MSNYIVTTSSHTIVYPCECRTGGLVSKFIYYSESGCVINVRGGEN